MGKKFGTGVLVEETGEIFRTMTECAEEFGVSVGTVSLAVSGKIRSCRGYHLRVIENPEHAFLSPLVLEELYYLVGYECEWREHPTIMNVYVSETGEVAKYKDGQIILKKQHQTNSGYLVVSVMDLGNKTNQNSMRLVHRLVAESFIRNDDPDYKTDVNHIDCDKLNNSVDNLEWCTKSENMQHAVRHGHANTLRVRVVETGKTYRSTSDCARDIDGTVSGIHDCRTGRQKQHRGYHFEFLDGEKR